jgi:hypothetical protein
MRTRTSQISLKIATFESPQLFCFLDCAQIISAHCSQVSSSRGVEWQKKNILKDIDICWLVSCVVNLCSGTGSWTKTNWFVLLWIGQWARAAAEQANSLFSFSPFTLSMYMYIHTYVLSYIWNLKVKCIPSFHGVVCCSSSSRVWQTVGKKEVRRDGEERIYCHLTLYKVQTTKLGLYMYGCTPYLCNGMDLS